MRVIGFGPGVWKAHRRPVAVISYDKENHQRDLQNITMPIPYTKTNIAWTWRGKWVEN